MIDRIKKGLKKSKGTIIVILILWLILAIVFVAPMAISLQDAGQAPKKEMFDVFLESIAKYITNPLNSIGTALSSDYISSYLGFLWKFSLVYLILGIWGISKAMPKSEYDDIEHGSSDWCENGEEYKTLSKNKGIILAEKEYLPVDKRGNVNVLVVGRFWFSENLHLMLYQMHINY